MKKTISVIVAAALLLTALAVFVCTDVKFNNPIDMDGTNKYENQLKENPDYDTAGAFKTDNDGVAAYFTDTEKYRKKCDATVPVVSLVGAKSVTITTNDVADFRKWMHLDGGQWSALIKWGEEHKNVDAKKPRLTRGGTADVPYEDNKVPEPGANYVIVYRVEKPECSGKVPSDEISRNLIIEQYVAPVTDTVRILLLGSATIGVKEGETSKYIDDGVDVMFGSQNVTAEALDSVVIKRGSNVELRLKDKPIDFKKIVLSATAPAETRYTITYYASKNGKSVNVVRTVNVTEASVVGNPEAVIVLETYKHTVGSKTINHPDTMLYIGAKDADYKEKGVKEVYYMKDGKKETLPATLVEITAPSGNLTIGNTRSPAERKYNYRLPDGAGYKGATAQRSVFMVDNTCEGPSKPEVTLLPSAGALEIPAGVVWSYSGSWKVEGTDNVEDGKNLYGAGFQYLIDFDGGKLDPKSPKAGTYTVTYVGLGKCGKMSDPVTRSVTVK